MINKATFGKVKKAILTFLSKVIKLICKPFRLTGKFIVKQWNFYLADFSFKRIYRNSEGHIIPLLGGVLALSIFHSINYLIYSNAIKYSNVVGGKAVLSSLIVFMALLFVVWAAIYQIKKANLRDDAVKELEKMFIKHCNPYDYKRDLDKSENIANKNFYYSFYFITSLSEGLDKYIEYERLYHMFKSSEIKLIENKLIANIVADGEKKLDTLPLGVIEKLRKQDLLPIDFVKSSNRLFRKFQFLIVLKVGNPEHPHNSKFAKIDIKKRDSSFVIFESVPREKQSNFYDINSQHITHAKYKKDKVELTIANPNAKPYKITISLSDWLANRNDLE